MDAQRGTLCGRPMAPASPLKLLPFAGVSRPPRGSLASAYSPRHQLELAGGRVVKVRSTLDHNRPGGQIEQTELFEGETRFGHVELVDEAGARTSLKALIFGEEKQEDRATFAVAPGKQRLFAIAGSFPVYTPRSWWSTGRLYQVDLATRRASLLYEPDVQLDKRLIDCDAPADDEVWLLSQRVLRVLRCGPEGAVELGSVRVSDARELAVGEIAGTRVALVLCVGKSGTSKTVVVALRGGKLTKLGEILDAVREVRVDGAHALVARSESPETPRASRPAPRWFEIDLSDALTETKAPRKKAAAESERPPAKRRLEMVERPNATRPELPAELRAQLAGVHSSRPPRLVAPGRAAVLDYDGVLHVVTAAGRLRIATPTYAALDPAKASYKGWPASFFDIAPSGRRAWLVADRRVFERDLPDDPRGAVSLDASGWRPLRHDGAGWWGASSVAAIEDDHVVVRGDEALDLLARDGEAWRPLHRVAVPANLTLSTGLGVHLGSVAVTTATALRLYARHGAKLQKLHELKLPTPRFRGSLLPVAVFTPGNSSIWIDGPVPAEILVHDE
jgi:hypothetical protein